MIHVGILNVDHPELTNNRKEADRFGRIRSYLQSKNCDLLLILEANGAMQLDGYAGRFSAESPFINRSRSSAVPNVYCQVGLYSRLEGRSRPVNDPVNGLLFELTFDEATLYVYANVMTIKDQWSDPKVSTYSERVDEQLSIMKTMSGKSFLIGGDFNSRADLAWHASEFTRISECVDAHGWQWPTRTQTAGVQHIIHSTDLVVSDILIDDEVKYRKTGNQVDKESGLSDHPFIRFALERVSPCT